MELKSRLFKKLSSVSLGMSLGTELFDNSTLYIKKVYTRLVKLLKSLQILVFSMLSLFHFSCFFTSILSDFFYILGKSELGNDRLSVEDKYAEFRFS